MKHDVVRRTGQGLGLLACGALLLAAASGCGGKAGAQAALPTPTPGEAPIGERPAIEQHVSEADIVSGAISIDQCFALGQQLFVTKFNKLDGLGRPGATGNGAPTERTPGSAPDFVRTSSPDSVSCAACHNDPRPGGAGDFVANVFVGANNLDPVTFDVRNADERNTLGMMGAGPVELLGREMTADLQKIKANAVQQAMSSHAAVTVPLNTKGVNFGSLTANADGSVDTSGVQGVDPDLIIKPFSQKGVTRSLREFTVNAMNHHHGMEAVERFGKGQLDSHGNVIQTDDFDQDGVPDELTVGDITAITLFQALLNTPAQVFPPEPDRQAAALRGEQIFNAAGCTSCHVPSLVLNNPEFCEPYSLNPPGTFSDQTQKVCANLTQDGPGPRLKPDSAGVIRVFAYTDLKRHVICDSANPHYCNEPNPQSGVPTNEFLTRKLWDVGSSAPYGHRGDLGTITEAILAHGGEATTARDAFAALPADQQADIVEFLKTLQVVPDGTQALVVDSLFRPLDKAALAKQLGIM
jgi:cytochrome c peroxidase